MYQVLNSRFTTLISLQIFSKTLVFHKLPIFVSSHCDKYKQSNFLAIREETIKWNMYQTEKREKKNWRNSDNTFGDNTLYPADKNWLKLGVAT